MTFTTTQTDNVLGKNTLENTTVRVKHTTTPYLCQSTGISMELGPGEAPAVMSLSEKQLHRRR